MAKPLLNSRTLDTITRQLYGSVEVAFYSVTPEAGEVEIARITRGVHINRERQGEVRGRGVKLLLAGDVDIDQSLLRIGAVVGLVINGSLAKYTLQELLPAQQLGGGYSLRLEPHTGATG